MVVVVVVVVGAVVVVGGTVVDVGGGVASGSVVRVGAVVSRSVVWPSPEHAARIRKKIRAARLMMAAYTYAVSVPLWNNQPESNNRTLERLVSKEH